MHWCGFASSRGRHRGGMATGCVGCEWDEEGGDSRLSQRDDAKRGLPRGV